MGDHDRIVGWLNHRRDYVRREIEYVEADLCRLERRRTEVGAELESSRASLEDVERAIAVLENAEDPRG